MLAAALIWFATAAELSRTLTAAAEDLLKVEKKIAASTEAGSFLYQDVLSLLDETLDQDKTNLHAHARTAEVLVLMSDEGDGTFDVCTLLEAREEAEYVLKHGGEGADADLAHKVIRAIQEIPPEAIPDPPSACEQDEEHRHGSKPRSS
jgi:imidazolonepropionase-like amidohydrolase